MGSLDTKLILVLVVFTILAKAESENHPVVSTKFGSVRGVRIKGHYEFRKIPFAKPPVGALRFKPPEDPEPWSDVLDAGKDFPDYCIQYNVFWNTTEGVEDCLYVNVFTPKVSSDGELLPVMFYIHSGGFMFGRGSHFRADYLMETKRVVTVIFQYRLGSFGFLNTEDEHSFGNMGMKDQLKALKWTRDNIAEFGGDKDRVMILGTSAGAASVHYHILSPQSKGLFHGAFSGSGTALCPWAFQRRPKENALKLGELLNCPTASSAELVHCLRQKDYNEIGMAHSKLLEFLSDPIAAFGPSLEVGNPDKSSWFLPAHPADIIEAGVVNKVPWIVGFNSDEGWEHTKTILSQPNLVTQLNEEWERVFPITLEYVNESEEDKLRISKAVREFYFQNEKICMGKAKNLSNVYSDKTYVLCTLRSASRHAQLGKHPVYLFLFDYRGDSSIATLKGYPRDEFGSNHMDDIQYLINSPLFKFLEEGSKDKPFQTQYANMMITFAENGFRNMPPFSKDAASWQPLDAGGKLKWYHINSDPKMKPMPEDWFQRMNFWSQFHLQEYSTSNSADRQPKDEL